MAERIKNIKETASDAVEIIRELGTPEVQDSLEKIRETAKMAQGIIESLKDPAMVANFENIRKTAESFENTSARIEAVTEELKKSGVMDEAREVMKAAKGTMGAVSDSKNMGETMDAIKEMLRSISGLVEEIKLTVQSSKKDGVIHDAEEAIRETRSIVERK